MVKRIWWKIILISIKAFSKSSLSIIMQQIDRYPPQCNGQKPIERDGSQGKLT